MTGHGLFKIQFLTKTSLLAILLAQSTLTGKRDIMKPWNEKQVEASKSLLGENTVEMLLQSHRDALWILENLGVGCKQPELQDVFRKFEAEGLAVVYEGRIFVTSTLIEKIS